MKKKYLVTGMRPAVSKRHNQFIEHCDLGISGAFMPFSQVATLTLKEGATEEQTKQHPEALKNAYEEAGCYDVKACPI